MKSAIAILLCILLSGLLLTVSASRSARRRGRRRSHYIDASSTDENIGIRFERRDGKRFNNDNYRNSRWARKRASDEWNHRVAAKRRGRISRDSASIHALEGVLRIRVVGTGDACLQTIRHQNRSYRRQFGDTTEAWAFIDLYGLGNCEEGSVGRAFGMVKAWVVAEAYEKGEECLATVITNVIARTHDPDPNDGVSVTVGGVAEGEALALCS